MMEGAQQFQTETTDDHVVFTRHDYSHPRFTKITTDEDIANLPTLPQEYSVPFERFDDGDLIAADAIIRVRPDRRKSAWVEFRYVPKGRMKRVPIGLFGKLSLEQMKIAAARIVEKSYEEGPPKSRIRLPRDTPLVDAWACSRSTNPVSRAHDKSRQAVMERHIISKYGNAPVSYLTKSRTRELLETLSLIEGGQARTLLKHFKRFLAWCVRVGLIEANPLHHFKLLMPRSRKASLTIDELARIIKATGQIAGPWQNIVALSVATTECVEDIRQMRGEDIDIRRLEWWKSHRNDSSPYGIPDDHGVFLNDFALHLLKGLSQPKGFVFQSPRKRHNGQATLVELELAIQWRSGITEKIRELSNVPGDWTMKEVRRSAIIMSGLQRVEQMYAEDTPDARKAARERALKEWSRKLFKAMEDQRSAFDALLPEEEVVI
jgi:hypothetical protein